MSEGLNVVEKFQPFFRHSATLITTNMVYKQWPRIFNNDATLTTAILDRLVHHCETVTIEGKSYRTKDEA